MNIRAELFHGVDRAAFGRVVATLSLLGSEESIVLEAVVQDDGSPPEIKYSHPSRLSLAEARSLHRSQHRFFDAIDRMRSSAAEQNAASA